MKVENNPMPYIVTLVVTKEQNLKPEQQ